MKNSLLNLPFAEIEARKCACKFDKLTEGDANPKYRVTLCERCSALHRLTNTPIEDRIDPYIL